VSWLKYRDALLGREVPVRPVKLSSPTTLPINGD
jgi:hypothetical protein